MPMTKITINNSAKIKIKTKAKKAKEIKIQCPDEFVGDTVALFKSPETLVLTESNVGFLSGLCETYKHALDLKPVFLKRFSDVQDEIDRIIKEQVKKEELASSAQQYWDPSCQPELPSSNVDEPVSDNKNTVDDNKNTPLPDIVFDNSTIHTSENSDKLKRSTLTNPEMLFSVGQKPSESDLDSKEFLDSLMNELDEVSHIQEPIQTTDLTESSHNQMGLSTFDKSGKELQNRGSIGDKCHVDSFQDNFGMHNRKDFEINLEKSESQVKVSVTKKEYCAGPIIGMCSEKVAGRGKMPSISTKNHHTADENNFFAEDSYSASTTVKAGDYETVSFDDKRHHTVAMTTDDNNIHIKETRERIVGVSKTTTKHAPELFVKVISPKHRVVTKYSSYSPPINLTPTSSSSQPGADPLIMMS